MNFRRIRSVHLNFIDLKQTLRENTHTHRNKTIKQKYQNFQITKIFRDRNTNS